MPLVLADVYLGGGRNVRLPTTPGRSVQFTGGHGVIVDHRDMPHVFGVEGARIYPRPESMPWAPEWLGKTDFMKADVHWPDGWNVEYLNKDEFRIYGPPDQEPGFIGPPVGPPTTTPPVTTVDITDRQEERKWVRPEDLLDSIVDPEQPVTEDLLSGPDGTEPPPEEKPVEDKPKRARSKRPATH